MPATAEFFRFLDQILNVLVIDPDPEFCTTFYTPFFHKVPCCSLHYAHSIDEALKKHLTSGKRYHLCITELGMGTRTYDEFHILKNYARHSSIAVVSGVRSAERGAQAMLLGARGVFDKGPHFNWEAFYTAFCRMLLINIINHRYDERAGDSLTLATKILFDKKPPTVTEWAEHLRITDRQLRNLWHSGCGFGAKQMLFLHDCMRTALQYYGCLHFSENTRTLSPESLQKKKLATYFKSHREVLLYILS